MRRLGSAHPPATGAAAFVGHSVPEARRSATGLRVPQDSAVMPLVDAMTSRIFFSNAS
jgi:hypothetical protein